MLVPFFWNYSILLLLCWWWGMLSASLWHQFVYFQDKAILTSLSYIWACFWSWPSGWGLLHNEPQDLSNAKPQLLRLIFRFSKESSRLALLLFHLKFILAKWSCVLQSLILLQICPWAHSRLKFWLVYLCLSEHLACWYTWKCLIVFFIQWQNHKSILYRKWRRVPDYIQPVPFVREVEETE